MQNLETFVFMGKCTSVLFWFLLGMRDRRGLGSWVGKLGGGGWEVRVVLYQFTYLPYVGRVRWRENKYEPPPRMRNGINSCGKGPSIIET